MKPQLRRFVKDIHGEREFELVAGSNTNDDYIEPVFAIGEILSKTESGEPREWRWIHLKREDVKDLIEDYEVQIDKEKKGWRPSARMLEKRYG